MSVQQLTILGATGSIGLSTLDVVRRHSDRYQVFALSAASQWQKLADLCIEFQPTYAVIADPQYLPMLEQALAAHATQVLTGVDGLQQVAAHKDVDTVMAAIVGAAGLLPTLAAAEAGKKVLLANKEALVMAGHLFMQAVHDNGATLLPIDSEHNAIFQCLPAGYTHAAAAGVSKILLTASGGPFRTLALDAFAGVTPDQACAHPNWRMGRKISVDSASMMNKGLELIEACWLFNLTPAQVDVVIHPQSVIHSMVQYVDGSVLAQLGNPDMRTPIAHALAWPERIASGVAPLDIIATARLDFEAPDLARFPCLRLAFEAAGNGCASTVLNAANEVAVEAFLAGKLGFDRIAVLNEHAMQQLVDTTPSSLDQVLRIDREARRIAHQWLDHGRLRGDLQHTAAKR
ncbi:1-deoxy-D-xylulose-5-phosphate reductoisomerase [Simiduia curdlanivorans]|uniref:1-deoxy-D-xylulose 5-phosphate reductoisomerase n=1 Tax=Simiduia curdlanivorans TaxID=1492769 RepID=A0ABV8UZA9_9GAMM|nr:1-deoxy-D-xylulose-5-phosphate reductoisomerase [Simiduia curdlanivorans]MDN3640388.1 1-deoxy-D-xylulose-5-phosphate reductoisomerase [Simiduia curdlanivorans]